MAPIVVDVLRMCMLATRHSPDRDRGGAPTASGVLAYRHRYPCRSMSPEAQAEYIAAVGRGDATALAQLYDVFATGLRTMAEGVLDDPQEVEDVIQEIFLRICERSDQFDPSRGSVWAWLATSLRNACIDRNRRDRRGRRWRARQARAASASYAPIEQDYLAITHAQRALGALPDAQKQTIERAFWHDESYPVIAARGNVPLNTVKARAARGLQALRSEIESPGASRTP